MWKINRSIFCALLMVQMLLSLGIPFAFFHPLGNFSINRHSLLEVTEERIHVFYVVDMAEIPALHEKTAIDRDRNGMLSDQERMEYLRVKCDELARGLRMNINGNSVASKRLSEGLIFPPGQGGLLTQRLNMVLEFPLPPSKADEHHVVYDDHNYQNRLGWKEIIARPTSGVNLVQSTVPEQSKSDELRNYPQEMLYKPLSAESARLIFKTGAGVPGNNEVKRHPPKVTAHENDMFSRLVTTQALTLSIVLIALFSAMGLGAVHALSPGHGKSIVAAYLVGTRGTPKHAVFLGLTVTITHTIGVFALGLVTLFASRYILPEQLYPWLGTASGVIVLIMGATIFLKRLQGLKNGEEGDHHHHNHEHESNHGSGQDHHAHMREHHSHKHEHTMDHHHDDHHHGHSHLPTGMDGSPVTWRSLLALGISGGILPCPSALVVLLGAISLHRVGFGLVLIVAFSIGLAGVLTGIGLFFVKGRELLGRFTATSQMVRFLPVASAFIITILGVGITLNAVSQFFI